MYFTEMVIKTSLLLSEDIINSKCEKWFDFFLPGTAVTDFFFNETVLHKLKKERLLKYLLKFEPFNLLP